MSFSGISGLFVPALCIACQTPSGSGSLLCGECLAELESIEPLAGPTPPDVDQLFSCAPHEGVARSVLAAFKFQRLLEVGVLIATRMSLILPDTMHEEVVMPVPASPVRRRLRGFDAAEFLSIQVAASVDWRRHSSGVLARVGTGRQRGQGRTGRMESPPDIRATRNCSGRVLLVDDVTTTGATLSACARVLLSAGARSVSAVTFTNRL